MCRPYNYYLIFAQTRYGLRVRNTIINIVSWKPDISNVHGAPIPLYFDYESFDDCMPVNPQTQEEYPVAYLGPRFRDSIDLHKAYANKNSGYRFKFPTNMNLIEAA